MARSISAKDAKSLIQQHQALTDQLQKNCAYATRQQRDCGMVANTLAGRNVFARLVQSELIDGNISDTVSDDIRQLIYCLHKCLQSAPLSEESNRIMRETHGQITQEINRLKPAANALQWFFTSGPNRIKAAEAYESLLESANGSYAWQIHSAARDIRRIDNERP